MQSYQIVDWGQPLQRRERATPTPQGTQVLVRVGACGVCHSDLHIQEGHFDLGGGNKLELGKLGVKLPHTMGHEIVGEVVALGPEATGARIGDKRVVYPWIGCGTCDFCQRGEELLCSSLRSLGARTDGGYSDYVLVPHGRYLIDHAGIAPELACTYACSGLTAYSALKKLADLPARDTLVVIGAGGVGLNAVLLGAAMLQARVVVADIDPSKREAALKAGAAAAIDNAAPDAAAKLKAATASAAGAGGAIDFVGSPKTAQFGIDCLRKGGKLVVVGLFGGALPVPLPLLPQRLMTLMGSYVGTLAEMHELMALLKTGKVKPLPVKTRPLAEVNQVLDDLRAGRIHGRVVVTP